MEDNYNELLLRCAQHKDRQAFKLLYEACSPKLYSLAMRLLNNEGLAEDVVQDSFMKIWSSASSYQPGKGKAITWMATVTRNKALDKLRAAKSRPQETESQYEGLDFMAADPEPDGSLQTDQGMSDLMKCLEELQEEQRECILLSYYYGHTHQELSEQLDKPLGTVKAWIRRGLDKLRICMD